jgi:hypothetical protein
MSVVKSGPPDQIVFGPGAFFIVAGSNLFFNMEEMYMDKRELAYVKQTIFAVKDWDAFQNVLRFWSRLIKSSSTAVCIVGVKKA